MGNIFEERNVKINETKINVSKWNIAVDDEDESETNNYQTADNDNNSVIEKANKKAENIIKDAELKANEIYKEAFDNAYKEGYDDGYNQGHVKGLKDAVKEIENKYENLIKQGQGIVQKMLDEKLKIINEEKEGLIDLAVTIAEHILNYEIDTNSEVMKGIFQKLFNQFVTQGNEKIIVNGNNKSYIQKNPDLLGKKINKLADINIEERRNMDDTECVISTNKGMLEAGVKAQFEQLKTALQKEKGKGNIE